MGVPRSERVHSLTLTPGERLLSLNDVPGTFQYFQKKYKILKMLEIDLA